MAFGNGPENYVAQGTVGFGACGNNGEFNRGNDAPETPATTTAIAKKKPANRLVPKGLWDAPTGDPVDPADL